MLSDDPRSVAGKFGELAAVAALGLSGPLIVFFAPWFAWRWWRTRSRHGLAVVAVGVVRALVMVSFSCYRVGTNGPGTWFRCRGVG